MPSRHKVVKFRSRNRHATVTPLQEETPVSSYTLDLTNECLRCGEHPIPLPPKAFAVLRYLTEHPGRLVTKQALLDAAWPDIAVTEAVLKNAILTLRTTLGDNAKTPRFIETVHRRGYRLIAPLTTAPPVSSSKFGHSALSPQPSVLVGREAEFSQLHRWLETALEGERQIVFVTGEPGIGKTTVVEAFLARITRGHEHEIWIGRGQCIEHYGAGEAYLPVLEALGRLCREPGGERLIELLSQQAPTWLVQMPALLDAAELERLQRKTAGATRERMLRELAEALEALTLERPLVLWLEDLHWSDVSTLEWLAFVARRRERARVFILGTYRPVEMLTDGHPLKRVLQEFYAHQLGSELALRHLTESEVSAYLTLRFPESVLPTRLGPVLQHRTGGNPLFLTSLVQDLTRREVLREGQDGRWEFHGTVAEVERWTPESVRQLLTRQRERLAPDEQRVLEAASLAGLEFSAAAVAAALETEAIEVEEHCGRLAEQQHFLRLAGISDWPDGTRAGRYGFLHALYQEFWHERVSVGKQQQWHLRMGKRKEAAYGQRTGEIAAELAVHFEQGRDYRRAVRYLQLAGENAVRRNAHQEASILLTKGLELLTTLPDTPERTQQELTLQLALNDALVPVKGYTVPDVEKTVTRARELCQQIGETPQLFPVLIRLALFYFDRGGFRTAFELSEQLIRMAQSVQDSYLLSLAHMVLGWTLLLLGEVTSARPHMEQAIALYDPQQHSRHTIPRGDPRVECLSYAAFTLWILGYPDQALKRSQEAVAAARGLSHPFSLAHALGNAASLHSLRREGQLARERAEALMTLSTEQGFPYWLAFGTTVRGSVLAEQGQGEEGIAQMQQGLAAFRAMGTEMERVVHLPALAAAYWRVGRVEEGLSVVAEALALVDKIGQRLAEAGLYVLKGLLLARSRENQAEAEACFRQAIEIARRQSAKSVELRAVMSLSRLWQRQGKKKEAHEMLAEIYGWFTEGFDTKDLQEAKTLLEKLH